MLFEISFKVRTMRLGEFGGLRHSARAAVHCSPTRVLILALRATLCCSPQRAGFSAS